FSRDWSSDVCSSDLMKGATVARKSMPPAKPQAVTTPPYLVAAQTFAKTWLPTTSTAPAQRSFAKGLPGEENSARSNTCVAPSERSEERRVGEARLSG